jgi:hypothetical protein
MKTMPCIMYDFRRRRCSMRGEDHEGEIDQNYTITNTIIPCIFNTLTAECKRTKDVDAACEEKTTRAKWTKTIPLQTPSYHVFSTVSQPNESAPKMSMEDAMVQKTAKAKALER